MPARQRHSVGWRLRSILASIPVVAVVVGLALLTGFRLVGERALLGILVGGVPPMPVLLAMLVAATATAATFQGLRLPRLMVARIVFVVGVGVVVTLLLTPSSSPRAPLPPSTSTTASMGRPLRVAAWNMAKGSFGLDGLVAGVHAVDVDVVCLSEAGSYDWLPDVDSHKLPALLGEDWTLVGDSEVRALVRRPDGDRGVTVVDVRAAPLAPGPGSRPLLLVTVRHTATGDVVVGCLHLMPKLLFQGDAVDRGAARTGTWREIAAASWQQGQALHDVVAALPRPAVIAGDFNNVAHGAIVGGVLDAGFVDALRLRGAGPFAVTFSDRLRGKRIDHLLVSRDLRIGAAVVVDVGGSDHRPVLVELSR